MATKRSKRSSSGKRNTKRNVKVPAKNSKPTYRKTSVGRVSSREFSTTFSIGRKFLWPIAITLPSDYGPIERLWKLIKATRLKHRKQFRWAYVRVLIRVKGSLYRSVITDEDEKWVKEWVGTPVSPPNDLKETFFDLWDKIDIQNGQRLGKAINMELFLFRRTGL